VFLKNKLNAFVLNGPQTINYPRIQLKDFQTLFRLFWHESISIMKPGPSEEINPITSSSQGLYLQARVQGSKAKEREVLLYERIARGNSPTLAWLNLINITLHSL
jgi:hypothetical protein